MHAPSHSFMFAGQLVTHAVPLHETLPPVGATQGVHEVPQLATSVFERHPLGHMCVPAAQPPVPPEPPAPPRPAEPVVPAAPLEPADPVVPPRPAEPAEPLAPLEPAPPA